METNECNKCQIIKILRDELKRVKEVNKKLENVIKEKNQLVIKFSSN